MGFRLKASAAQVGIVVIALAALGTSVQAQGQQRTEKLTTSPAPVVVKKDVWGDPDSFLAKCNAAGGGASTDDVGLPHCEDANGGNIPIPMDD